MIYTNVALEPTTCNVPPYGDLKGVILGDIFLPVSSSFTGMKPKQFLPDFTINTRGWYYGPSIEPYMEDSMCFILATYSGYIESLKRFGLMEVITRTYSDYGGEILLIRTTKSRNIFRLNNGKEFSGEGIFYFYIDGEMHSVEQSGVIEWFKKSNKKMPFYVMPGVGQVFTFLDEWTRL